MQTFSSSADVVIEPDQGDNHLQNSGGKVSTEKDSQYWKIAAQLQAAEKDFFQVRKHCNTLVMRQFVEK